MRKTVEAKKNESVGITPTSVYLILYNGVQAIGWTALAIQVVIHLVWRESRDDLYSYVKTLLNVFQTLALLEIVHAATGIVRSNVVLTAFQVMSRVFLVWGVLNLIPETRDSIGLLLILIAWTVTEIVRYTYYMTSLVRGIPYILQWARYTLFFVLYPLGVTGELLCVRAALPYVYQRSTWSYSLPNSANISFQYYYALLIIMMSYVPLFPQLYFHMISQRKKVIGGVEHRKRD
jgi:very-long-chain (3R)-3-hydroxyacyl-CoA dehydratase